MITSELRRFGPFTFDPRTRELKKFGLKIRLEEKPALLLCCLLDHAGEPVSRETLQRLLWPNGVNTDYEHGLNKTVNKLRSALGEPASKPQFVETLSKQGYRFIASVEVCGSTLEAPISEVHEKDQSATSAVRPTPESAPEPPLPEHGFGKLFRSRAALTRRLFGAATALAVVLLTTITLTHHAASRSLHPQALRTVISLPSDLRLITVGENAGIALSPDGSRIAFSAVGPSGVSMLWIRNLDSLTPRPIPGTESGGFPFWSPDGTQIGFFTDVALKRVNLKDGTVKAICSASSGRGGSWSKDDVIIFARDTRTPIYKIAATGGSPVSLTPLDGKKYTTHRWPRWLHDGRHFIFLAANHDSPTSLPTLFLGSIDGSEPKALGEADSNAIASDGALLYLSHGKLISQKLDLETATLQSDATILAEGVDYEAGSWHGSFDASDDVLVYRPRLEGASGQTLAWYDRDGHWLRNASDPGPFFSAQLSPDGNTIAVLCGDPGTDLCLIRADRTVTQMTNKPIVNWMVWSPDGTEITYSRHAQAISSTSVKSLVKNAPERVLAFLGDRGPLSWHPDGHHMLVNHYVDKDASALDVVDVMTNRIEPYLPAENGLVDGRFSPDGKWVAYTSRESGTDEIYLSSYPVPSTKYRVSTNGGRSPRWRLDGHELYFLSLDETLISVELAEDKHALTFSPHHQLFRPQIFPFPSDRQSFDVSADGKRFIINVVGSKNRSDLVLARDWSH